MKEFKHETMVITKEAWKFLRNADRVKGGYSTLTDEQLEKVWGKIAFRNGGAWSKTHPIAENEIRVENDSWNTMRIEDAKAILTENGFEYRQDGFVQEGINL